MITIAEMWDNLEKNPNDIKLKKELSATFRLIGQFELADTIDWCITQNRWPKYNEYNKVWEFGSGATDGVSKKLTAILPSPLYLETSRRDFREIVLDEMRTKECSALYRLEGCIRRLSNVFLRLQGLMPIWTRPS